VNSNTFTGGNMSNYTEISDVLKREADKNAELQIQIQQRTEELLSAFWKLKPMLKPVDFLELTPGIMLDWINSHLTKQG
jgi:hypothetical protein